MKFRDQTTREKILTLLPWGLLIGVFLLLVTNLVINYLNYLDWEISSELILAKMLSEGQGFIFTKQWCYSTELRFLGTQLIYTPLFWLFSNWQVVYIIGSIILNLILLGAFYFFLAALKMKKMFPWLATFLILPLSWVWLFIVNVGTYYIPHLVIAFLVLGFVFYALRTGKKLSIWCLIGASVLSMGGGVSGIRLLCVLQMPLVLAAIIYYFLNLKTEQKPVAMKLMLISSICLVTALLGFGVNMLLKICGFSFFNYLNLQWTGLNFDRITATLTTILACFGFNVGKQLLDLKSLANLGALFLVVFVGFCFVRILQKRQKYSPTTVLLTIFVCMGLLLLTLTYLFTNITLEDRFNLPVLVFVLPICADYLSQLQINHKQLLRGLIYGGVVGLCLCNTVWFTFVHRNYNYYNHHNDDLLAITQILTTNGYNQGYTTTTSGNIITALANGKIEVWTLDDGAQHNEDVNSIEPNPWLQKQTHMDNRPDDKIFVLFKSEENYLTLFKKLAAYPEYLFWQNENYLIYTYDSVGDLLAIIEN